MNVYKTSDGLSINGKVISNRADFLALSEYEKSEILKFRKQMLSNHIEEVRHDAKNFNHARKTR